MGTFALLGKVLVGERQGCAFNTALQNGAFVLHYNIDTVMQPIAPVVYDSSYEAAVAPYSALLDPAEIEQPTDRYVEKVTSRLARLTCQFVTAHKLSF